MEFELNYNHTNPHIFKDEDNGVYTVFTLDKGGPIISAPTLGEAKQKFETAMSLALALRKCCI